MTPLFSQALDSLIDESTAIASKGPDVRKGEGGMRWTAGLHDRGLRISKALAGLGAYFDIINYSQVLDTSKCSKSYLNGLVDAADKLHAKLETLKDKDVNIKPALQDAYEKIGEIIDDTILADKIATLSHVLMLMQTAADITDATRGFFKVASGIRLSGAGLRPLALAGGGRILAAGVEVDGATLAVAALNMTRASVIMKMSVGEGGGVPDKGPGGNGKAPILGHGTVEVIDLPTTSKLTPKDPTDTITLYHGTNDSSAANILEKGIIETSGGGDSSPVTGVLQTWLPAERQIH